MVSEIEFARIKGVVAKGVRTSERPPAFVFTTDYTVSAFVEFDKGLTADFWHLIRSFASATGDSCIFVLAVEPDAEIYFHKEFGIYGALQLSVTDRAEVYLERLAEHPEGWPVDSLKYNSECLVWTSDSGNWLAWGSRGFGFIALAFKTGFSIDLEEFAKTAGIHLFTKQAAISNLILPSFGDSNAGQMFANKFIQNY